MTTDPRNSARPPFAPNIRVAKINDYLLCFYDGRETAGYPDWIKVNIDMKLGLSCYVLFRGDKAIIFDTMLYKEQMIWIDRYLRDMGIRTFSVINSHWDADHIGGNALYRDCDIFSTDNTRWSIQMHAQALKSGDIWKPSGDPDNPGIEELVLPNRTFTGQLTLWLEDIEIQLTEVFIHQLGSLVAYLPRDRILLAADACEDTCLFVNNGSEYYLPIQAQAYNRLLSLDIERIYPIHGRFEVIDNGGYARDFLRAMQDYLNQLMLRLPKPDYLTADLESVIGPWIDKGILEIHEPYRWLHTHNVNMLHAYYKDRPIPGIVE
ncbi:MBL fold metallo-hydrolase [Devosia sp.]|uniref:MBL fold metallo-hydrolase n=1 Tax=Devosia sp. TaxID=1871048 RepID=UPI003A8D7EA5